MAADPVDVALDEARRKLARTEGSLDDVRTRAIGIMSATVVVTGLFGFRMGTHLSMLRDVLIALALIAFVLLVGLTIKINQPVKEGWGDGDKLGRWLQLIETADSTAGSIAFNLAAAINDDLKGNSEIVDDRSQLLRCMLFLAGAEVVFWALSIAF